MANSYTGIFQTLAASFNEASLAKEGKNVLMTMVTRDLSPSVAAPFQIINTNIMASTGTPTAFTPGTTTLTLSDLTINPGAVTLNQFPTYGVLLPSGDLSRTDISSFLRKVTDECIKKIGDNINSYIGGLITAANFPTNGSNASGGNDDITDAGLALAWNKLASAKVPVGDLGNLFLAVPPVVYSNLLQRQSWTQSAYVGDPKSGDIRSTARLGLQWGALVDFDTDVPGNGTGGTAAGTYASLLFHRKAIALVSRALAPPLDVNVPTTYVDYKGIPIRVTIMWNNLKRADELVCDAMFGASVVREDHGAYLITT